MWACKCNVVLKHTQGHCEEKEIVLTLTQWKRIVSVNDAHTEDIHLTKKNEWKQTNTTDGCSPKHLFPLHRTVLYTHLPRTHPLENPWLVRHCKSSHTFQALSLKMEPDKSPSESRALAWHLADESLFTHSGKMLQKCMWTDTWQKNDVEHFQVSLI